MDNKLVVIVGQTASGKSDLGVYLAKKFHGEIVSADSRQVYKGLDLASGKITKKETMGIPHHLLDILSAKQTYTVAQYQKEAIDTIKKIQTKGHTPFLLGGSPFYVYSVVDNLNFPKIKSNPALRRRLEKLSTADLLQRLKELDPERASSIEQKNPRRLIRALEIIYATGRSVPVQKSSPPLFSTLLLGIKKSPKELALRIEKRLDKRLSEGIIKEIKQLHSSGVSWKRLEELGLEARYISRFLKGTLSEAEMREQLLGEIKKFAKRQLTWFKKDKRIHWISEKREAEALVRKFL